MAGVLMFGAGDALVRLAGLILLPLFTSRLTPSEFGALTLAKLVAGIGVLVLSLGLPSAIQKLHFATPTDRRPDLYGSMALFLAAIGGAALVSFLLLRGVFETLLPEGLPYFPYLQYAAIAIAAEVGLSVLGVERLRIVGAAGIHLLLNSFRFVATVGLAWLLVGVLNRGPVGAMEAFAYTALITGGAVLLSLRSNLKLSFDMKVVRPALRIGIPLVPHFLAHWVLSGADRFIIAQLGSLADAGVYHVSYQVGSAVLIIVWAGSAALIPILGRISGDDAAANADASRLITWYLAVSAFGAVVVSTFGPDVITVLAGEAYQESATILPWVVSALFFVALYSPAMIITNLHTRRQAGIGLTSTLAAGLNVGLNYLLIPLWGLQGAAVATAASYLFMVIGFSLLARGKVALDIERARIGAITITVLLVAFLPSLIPGLSILMGFPARLGITIAVGGSLLAMAAARRPRKQHV